MAYILFALVLISLMLCLAILLRLSLYSPFVINALIWLVAFVPGLFFYEDFYPFREMHSLHG